MGAVVSLLASTWTAKLSSGESIFRVLKRGERKAAILWIGEKIIFSLKSSPARLRMCCREFCNTRIRQLHWGPPPVCRRSGVLDTFLRAVVESHCVASRLSSSSLPYYSTLFHSPEPQHAEGNCTARLFKVSNQMLALNNLVSHFGHTICCVPFFECVL